MSYQYFPLRVELHRDVAHWRGAKGGMRVLSLPSCQGWLRRQANDASYDFWPDLSIGAGFVRDRRSRVPPSAIKAQAVFIMHKDYGGEWDINRWQAEPDDQAGVILRSGAANSAEPAAQADLQAQSAAASLQPREASTSPAPAPISFIIEIGGSRKA